LNHTLYSFEFRTHFDAGTDRGYGFIQSRLLLWIGKESISDSLCTLDLPLLLELKDMIVGQRETYQAQTASAKWEGEGTYRLKSECGIIHEVANRWGRRR
jgi:hypothetical protein